MDLLGRLFDGYLIDVVELILSYVDFDSIGQARKVSRRWQRILSNVRVLPSPANKLSPEYIRYFATRPSKSKRIRRRIS